MKGNIASRLNVRISGYKSLRRRFISEGMVGIPPKNRSYFWESRCGIWTQLYSRVVPTVQTCLPLVPHVSFLSTTWAQMSQLFMKNIKLLVLGQGEGGTVKASLATWHKRWLVERVFPGPSWQQRQGLRQEGRCRLILFTSIVLRAPDLCYVSETLLHYSICSSFCQLQSRLYERRHSDWRRVESAAFSCTKEYN